MRDYGKVFSRIWESTDFRSLSEDGRTLALYLLTCQHGTIAGVFRVPDGYASEDLQWDVERVAEGFRNLAAKGFATRCDGTKWVWLHKFLEWNQPENPNQRKAAAKVAMSVPDQCTWKPAFMRVSGDFLGIEVPKEPNPSVTVQEGSANQYQYQYQKQEQEQEQEQEEKKTPRKRSVTTPDKPMASIEDLVQAGIPADVAAEFIAHKAEYKAPLTERAWRDHLAESAKAGWTPLQAAEKVMAKSWKGFEAKYVANEQAPSKVAPRTTYAEQDEMARRRRWEETTGRKWPTDGDVIDITPTQSRIAA